MRCPRCGSDAAGAFCAECGAPVSGASCPQCQAPLVPGALYCTQCGGALRSGASNLPWYIAGAALVALIIVLLLPVLAPPPQDDLAGGIPFSGRLSEGADGASGAGGAPTGTPPPLTGTPREQADRLFNRVMQARASGNTQESTFFLPMAIAAYERAGPLDADGLYHLSVLQQAAGQSREALETAERILATSPDHLLGLAAAAQAAQAAGEDAAARGYWQRFLDAYDEEAGRPLPEYTDHRGILPEYREQAEGVLDR